jgi:hypothetical protein
VTCSKARLLTAWAVCVALALLLHVSSTYRVPTDATSGGAHPLAVEQWAAPVSATRAPQGGVAATVGSELTEGEHYLGW